MVDQEITELQEITDIADDDVLYVVDSSDTSASPDGTSRKILVKNLSFGDVEDFLIGGSGNRPNAGTSGRIFIENDTGRVLYDDGNNWIEVGLSENQIQLGNLQTKKHSELSDAPSDAHHTKYDDESAQDAVGNHVSAPIMYNDSGPDYYVDVSQLPDTSPDGSDELVFSDADDNNDSKKAQISDLSELISPSTEDDGSEVVSNTQIYNLAGGFFDVSQGTDTDEVDITLTSQAFDLSFLDKMRNIESVLVDTASNRPAGGTANRIFVEYDTGRVLYDDGNGWIEVGLSEDQISLSNLGSLDAGSQKITNVSDPTNPQDVSTKSYTDSAIQGLEIKDSVQLSSTQQWSSSDNFSSNTITNVSTGNTGGGGGPAVDGTEVSAGDRLLAKNGIDEGSTDDPDIYNGLWVVDSVDTSNGVMDISRTSDMDEDSEVDGGEFVFVESGTNNSDKGFVVTSDSVTLNTDLIQWSQFSGAGQITAGSGLDKTGDTLSVNVDGTTIEISSDTLQIVQNGIGPNEVDLTADYNWTGNQSFSDQLNIDGIRTEDAQKVSSNTTIDGTNGHTTLVDTSGGNVTITLTSSPINEQTLTVKKLGGSGDVIIDGNGKNIDGGSSLTISTDWDSRTLYYYPSDDAWYTI